MRRRTFVNTLGAAVQALAAAPLLATDPELRIAVNRTTIESAPLLVQEIPGVRIVLVANGREASAQLVSGAVDAATGSETQLLLNTVAQPDLRTILTLSECRYRIVARRSAGILRGSDLKGKRIAATAGTSSLYFLVSMLDSVRLRQTDVTVVPMEGPDMPKAMVEGRVDAMAMWEPHAQNAIDSLERNGVVLQDGNGYVERFNLNTTAKVLADPAKRALLAKLTQSVREISGQLKPRIPTLAKAIATPEAVIARAWNQFRFPANLDQRGLLRLMERIEPWAAATAQRAPRPADQLARLIDESVLAEAAQTRSPQ